MKITKKELQGLVKEAVSAKLEKTLNEATALTAKRDIIDIASSLSRQFENDIVKVFNIVSPDELQPELQRQYLQIVEDMKQEFVVAAMNATKKLMAFPKNDETKA